VGKLGSEAEKPIERRPRLRKRSLLGALITYADGKFSFDCTIHDLSETGARITLPKNIQMPSRFYLINIRDRQACDAKIVWHKGSEAGVEFVRSFGLAEVSDPALNYLKRLWLERATR